MTPFDTMLEMGSQLAAFLLLGLILIFYFGMLWLVFTALFFKVLNWKRQRAKRA